MKWKYRSEKKFDEDYCNKLGQDGWELIGFDFKGNAWFKKILVEEINQEYGLYDPTYDPGVIYPAIYPTYNPEWPHNR